jgi:2-haloacid dehalogenase
VVPVPEFDPASIRVVACDVFGATVDWYTGVARQAGEIFRELGVDIDGGRFAGEWRGRYRPSMARVREGEREWAYLDTLHRESLDELLSEHGAGDAVDEPARGRLVRAWHRLPAWDDSVPGLARLAGAYVTAALSNGGFALLTNLVKAAALPFDCILSAELARAYKPDTKVYRTAAGLLDVRPDEILLV